jgi:hypothetical protein
MVCSIVSPYYYRKFTVLFSPSSYDAYSFSVIPAVGELVAGDRQSYQYLVESIRRFPKQVKIGISHYFISPSFLVFLYIDECTYVYRILVFYCFLTFGKPLDI